MRRYNWFILIAFLMLIIYSCDPIKKSHKQNTNNNIDNQTNKLNNPTIIYINTYKDMAVREMNRAKIPASITLAQGILESGNGNSLLAKQANNHFGIKCHNDWKGPSFYLDDDVKNECFRSYKNPDESFKDHSDFLMSKSRYSALFKLECYDYKGWAYGLKQAGYATRTDYSELLIGIIEKYKLHDIDRGINITIETAKNDYPVSTVNGIPVVVAKNGDTYESIAQDHQLDIDKLLKFNEAQRNDVIMEGAFVFLRKKKNKARESYHIFRKGEDIHSISQLYGIKSDRVYKMNMIEKGSVPVIGEILYLRDFRLQKAKTMSEKEYQNLIVQSTNKNISQTVPSDTIQYKSVDTTISDNLNKTINTNDNNDYQVEKIDSTQVTNTGNTDLIYIVEKGETLYAVSRKFNVPVDELIKLNNLASMNLNIGQKLIIKKASVSLVKNENSGANDNKVNQVTTVYDTTYYLAKHGDDLYGLSQRYNISVIDLINVNKIDVYELSDGQRLIVQIINKSTGKSIFKPISAKAVKTDQNATTNQTQNQPKKEDKTEKKDNVVQTDQEKHTDNPDEEYHIVKPGETLYRISINHKISLEKIKKLNGLKDNNIKVGQKLLLK